MPSFSRDNEKWTGTVNLTKPSTKVIIPTKGKYMDRDIEVNINITGVTLTAGDSFTINDGINTWNWNVDINGNVSIT